MKVIFIKSFLLISLIISFGFATELFPQIPGDYMGKPLRNSLYKGGPLEKITPKRKKCQVKPVQTMMERPNNGRLFLL